MLVDHGLGQHEDVAVVVVEPLRDIACHLDVLLLVPAHRHLGCLEYQDVSGHQDRVTVQRHRDPFIRIVAAAVDIGLHRRLVGMGAVHQALGGHAGQDPGQLGDLGNIRLPVEHRVLGVHAERQPGRRNFQRRLADLVRVLILRQRVKIREEVIVFLVRIGARRNARTNGAHVVADVRRARRRDPGEVNLLRHYQYPAACPSFRTSLAP